MKMPFRFVGRTYQIDTNMINAKKKLASMNKLEKWASDGVIEIIMSEVAMKEASSGLNVARKEKAYSHIYSLTKSTTQEEQQRMKRIECIVFPEGAKDQNQKNDVEIIFNALKYGRTLISNDGGSKRQPDGILGHSQELRKLGVKILRDAEAVNEVEKLIATRDENSRLVAQKSGEQLPKWVGKD